MNYKLTFENMSIFSELITEFVGCINNFIMHYIRDMKLMNIVNERTERM